MKHCLVIFPDRYESTFLSSSSHTDSLRIGIPKVQSRPTTNQSLNFVRTHALTAQRQFCTPCLCSRALGGTYRLRDFSFSLYNRELLLGGGGRGGVLLFSSFTSVYTRSHRGHTHDCSGTEDAFYNILGEMPYPLSAA